MADKDFGGQGAEVERELDQYIAEDEASRLGEFVNEQVRRSPWWAISFLVHVIVLLVMWRSPWGAAAEEPAETTIVISCPELRPEEQIADAEEPPEPELDENLDIPIDDLPPTNVLPDDADYGLEDLPLPHVDGVTPDDERPVPSIDPPSMTPVLGVIDKSKGYTHGYYSRRNRRGRGRMLGRPDGTTPTAVRTVDAGLLWLAKAQERDGRWSCKRWDGGDYDVGMTGLALLAYLGRGYTQKGGRFKTTVTRALHWLAANQKPNGAFTYKTFYEMGIAAMAVSEDYGLTHSPKVGRMAQRAINFICTIQPEHGGYRYGGAVPRNEGDMSVTGWQIMAVKSAICSDLDVPDHAIERFRVFLKNSYRDYGKSAYIVGNPGAGSATMWAVGMVCRQFLGGDFDDEIRAAANALLTDANNGDKLVKDLYYTYYTVLGMFQMGGEWWLQWNKRFRDPLVKAQIHKRFDARGRFVRGSWDPANHRYGSRGGRVYTTAMSILCLEVYYRFLPLYRAGS